VHAAQRAEECGSENNGSLHVTILDRGTFLMLHAA